MIADPGPCPNQGNRQDAAPCAPLPRVKLAISIAHAVHRPERRRTLTPMLDALADRQNYTHLECAPGKPHEWSERQWGGAITMSTLGSGCTHALLLNDDLVLCDGFLAVLANVIAARPNHLINLYNCHKLAHEAQARGMSWLTGNDSLIGNAYVIPIPSLRHFLHWRETALTPGTVETLSEDQLVNLWAMAHDIRIWHTIPALVEHDLSVPSCYGNTQCRSAEVGPRAGMLDINWETDALHIGRVFAGNHHALLTRVTGDRAKMVEAFYRYAGDALF